MNVFIQKDGELRSKSHDTFIRGNLIISGIKTLANFSSGYRAVVIINEKYNGIENPLFKYVTLSEGPAHRQWEHTREKFREMEYKYGHGTIAFIKDSIKNIIKIINYEDNDVDRDSFYNYFSIAIENTEDGGKVIKTTKNDTKEDIPENAPELK